MNNVSEEEIQELKKEAIDLVKGFPLFIWTLVRGLFLLPLVVIFFVGMVIFFVWMVLAVFYGVFKEMDIITGGCFLGLLFTPPFVIWFWLKFGFG